MKVKDSGVSSRRVTVRRSMSKDEPNGETVEGQDRTDEGSDAQDSVAHIHSLPQHLDNLGTKRPVLHLIKTGTSLIK